MPGPIAFTRAEIDRLPQMVERPADELRRREGTDPEAARDTRSALEKPERGLARALYPGQEPE